MNRDNLITTDLVLFPLVGYSSIRIYVELISCTTNTRGEKVVHNLFYVYVTA